MIAILSDIHGNLEAITAVLDDIQQQGVEKIYNLGDTVGYGPNPLECLDLAMGMDVTLLGCHDSAVLNNDAEGFCVGARHAAYWTRKHFDRIADASLHERRFNFLSKLPLRHEEGSHLYVHGSARNPLYEYLFPEDIFNERKLLRIGEAYDRICFVGHTHIPGIFEEQGPGKWQFICPEECESEYFVKDHRIIGNVGSVGQPRDLDDRACYVLFDGERIQFRRVEYDYEPTIRKIYAIPELIDFLGDRLREGR
jgi:diadenosine tetraphosphatase ApaH/serine/threonine PP2A family protein phosphatase